MEYGFVSLIPMLTALILAVITREAVLSLFLGGVVGCVILAGGNPAESYQTFIGTLYEQFTSDDFIWLAVIIAFFGGLILLLRKSGSVLGFAKVAEKVVNTRKKSMFATYILGIIIFIDEYLNNLVVGTAMSAITDKFKVSREMLTFIVTSTGATVCAFLPMSSWGVFMGGQMEAVNMVPGMGATQMFLRTMPFIFYGILSVVLVPLLILKIVPLYGPLKKAEEKALHAETAAAEGTVLEMEGDDVPEEKRRLVNFLVPILILAAIVIVNGDMTIAIIVTVVITVLLLAVQKIKSLLESCSLIMEGMTEMFSMIVLVGVSYMLNAVNAQLGMTDFVINSFTSHIPAAMFALFTFLVTFVLAFGTGTFWGIAIVAFPILIPAAQALGANVFLTAGAVISGVTMGAHTCFFGDTVILACSTTRVNTMEYSKCAMPICAIPCVLTMILYVVCGIIL